MRGLPEEIAAVAPRLESADASRLVDVLREAKLSSVSRQLTVSPEDVPLGLLDKIAALNDGHSIVIPQSGGARVLTRISSQPAPLTREQARPAIQAFLANDRKRRAIQDLEEFLKSL